ncbi:putative ABC transport system permease protein [Pedobacter sp. UYEF25]
MFKNYLKIAWRNILKRKFYSILNILGLAIAASSAILIYLYISYNLSFDTYHKAYQNIFRVVYELHLEKTEYDKGGSVAIYNKLKSESAQVRQAALKMENQSFVVNISAQGKNRFKEDKNIAFVDENWFSLFSYKFIQGNYKQLDEPNTVVLTEKIAKKYFGKKQAINQSIFINKQEFKVIGVVSDKPYQSDLKSDIYLSFASFKNLNPEVEKSFFTDWGSLSSKLGVYVKLNNQQQSAVVEKQLASTTREKFGADGAKYYHFELLPLSNLHFSANYGGTVQKSLFNVLTLIGFLIVIIASVNYINLMLAGQARDAINIGTRKAFGASRKQLFVQFMVDSFLNCAIALSISGLVVSLLLPFLNEILFFNAPIQIASFKNLVLYAVSLFILISILTGMYPALVLSRLNVVKVLKSKALKMHGAFGRKLLVIFQNVIAQCLIAATIIMVMQVHLLTNTDKGFDRESVIMVPIGKISDIQKARLGQELNALSSIQSFSYVNNPPSSSSERGATVKFSNRADWEKWPARFAIGDFNYPKTFGLTILAGRSVRANSSKPEFLINKTMLNALKVKDVSEVLGKELTAGDYIGIIVGIVKDFNVKSLIGPIEPSVVLQIKNLETNLAIKLPAGNPHFALQSIEQIFKQRLPEQVFSYQFLDDEIATLYNKETLQQNMIWMASCVAITICVMGLLGLISLITLQRTKEIGIRKTLGATVFQIGLVLTKEFMYVTGIAFVLAVPLCYWIMSKWLTNFAYRIELTWWIFAISGALAVIITLATISFQAIKAAVANPIISLRSE